MVLSASTCFPTDVGLLVAPTEPKAFDVLGDRSSVPETYGCDFLGTPQGRLVGIQRKTCADLVASLRDDRLSRELSQIQALHRSVLCVEGAWGWNSEGTATKVHGGDGKGSSGFTRSQFDGVMLSCQVNGMIVLHSDGIADTIRQITQVVRFFERESHDSLFVRPKYRADEWGTAAHRGWAIHLLQSFPGISVVTAAAIYDAVGLPLRWDDDTAELLKLVPGCGPKRIAALLGAFRPQNGD